MSNASSHGVISAFTEDQASRLTGLTVHQLRYWDRTGFFRPQFADPNRRSPFSRIYSFRDIASLRVLSVLTKQYSVSVRHLRDVAARLCAMDGNAWSRTTLYVLKRRVNFVDPEDGKQREIVSGQYALGIPLETVMSDTRRDVEALSVRSSEDVGAVERSRFVASNALVVAGTRIPVAAVRSFVDAGYSPAQIMQEYPTLSEADIRAAVSFDRQTKAA